MCEYINGTIIQEDFTIPDDWVCPICGVGKDMFVKAD